MSYCTFEQVANVCRLSQEDFALTASGWQIEYEEFINLAIDQAQSIIDTYCNVPAGFFAAGGVTVTDELYDWRACLGLRCRPVITMSKVEINRAGPGIAPYWYEIPSTQYVLSKTQGLLYNVIWTPGMKQQSVRVSYTAGYSTVPAVINTAAMQLASNILHGIYLRLQATRYAHTMQGDMEDYLAKTVPDAMTADIKDTLASYVRTNL